MIKPLVSIIRSITTMKIIRTRLIKKKQKWGKKIVTIIATKLTHQRTIR